MTRKTRSLYITCHAQKLTTVVQLFLFIIITVRYSLNHHVKIIDALAANRPHQPMRHLVTAATTAAVATAAGQITSKSLAGGSKSQGNPREGKDLAGTRSSHKRGWHGEGLARATDGRFKDCREHEQLRAQWKSGQTGHGTSEGCGTAFAAAVHVEGRSDPLSSGGELTWCFSPTPWQQTQQWSP